LQCLDRQGRLLQSWTAKQPVSYTRHWLSSGDAQTLWAQTLKDLVALRWDKGQLQLLHRLPLPADGRPVAVAQDPQGRFDVLCRDAVNLVTVDDPKGHFLKEIPLPELRAPNSLQWGPHGRLWIMDWRCLYRYQQKKLGAVHRP